MGQYTITTARSGHKTAHYSDGKTTVRLHSAYDPCKEAVRAVEEFSVKRASIILVSGLGLGYHIAQLHEKFPNHSIIVLEKDRQLTALALKEFPHTLSLCPIVHNEEEMLKVLELIDMHSFKGTALFVHRPSYSLHPPFYDALLTGFHKQMSSRISDLLTRFEFEELWVKNILLNSMMMNNAVPVQSLFGRFKGMPGIIVSAGPSLVDSLDALHKACDKALIVCVDTAYKVLERHGIVPHIVMTLDAQIHSVKHFLGIQRAPLVLADAVSCPQVARRVDCRIFSTTAKYYTAGDGTAQRESTPLMEWVQKHTGQIGDIQSGGSVATSAFDLVLNSGCSAIVLAGQDLAYTGREIHSRGTHHNDDWLPGINRYKNLDTINQSVIRRRKIKKVPANNGGKVITDFVFDLYRNWFEDSARTVPVAVFNTSAGGAVIANTTFAHLDVLVRQWKTPAVAPQTILAQVLSHTQKIHTMPLFHELSKIKESLRALSQHAQSGEMPHFFTLLNDDSVDAVCAPFMRKTLFYIARHDVEQEKAEQLIANAAIAATQHLLKIFDRILV